MSADLSEQEAAVKTVITEWERTCGTPYAQVSRNVAVAELYQELRRRLLVPDGEKAEARIKKIAAEAIEAWAMRNDETIVGTPLTRRVFHALNNEGLFRIGKTGG